MNEVSFLYLIPALLLGWALGSNNSPSILGPPVLSGLISYRKAIVVSSIFVVLGSIIGGNKGFNTLSNLVKLDLTSLSLSVICAFLTIIIMSNLALPASATQAVVGSLVGMSVLKGEINLDILKDIFISWILTPFGALIIAVVCYRILALVFKNLINVIYQDVFIKILSWVVITYSSYSLGANNVANVTGVYVNILYSPFILALIGGVSIGVGILMTNRKVLNTVGKDIVELDHFSSLISILATAITLWFYSLIGIPVSIAQAIIGAIIGVGLATGTRTFNNKTILKVVIGWIGTPSIAAIISIAMVKIFEAII